MKTDQQQSFEIAFRQDGDAVLIPVRLSPRASRDAILGVHGGSLKIAVAAPPVDNQANEHLIKFLAKILSMPKSALTIVHGAASKNKVLRVSGLTAPEALRKILAAE